ncbi:NADH-quinone oxidoreductase subunit NuoN [[Mycobacterium] wendilense]|uniref:NADH-quinone oxidoreductase subunit N n=1 Tax=[Mycobacterium] wendilense TaxID=3064284 RepID=A0ABN9P357_9MYCO|nr:NADH-quinone oxidoreductase subunit NuoN [Mycolicibacterium sp. MU0050]CAJ1584261.1 NADH-quinone oxidoreductase subunit NuoN [Mycolicibacterium sp. MU0050]
MTTLAALTTPSVEYRAVLPLLVVFGAAVAGVLIEGFVPRARRVRAQLALAYTALLAALLAVVTLAGTSQLAVMGAVAIDGPTLFLQAAILIMALFTMVVLGSRSSMTITAQASSVPGGAEERTAIRVGAIQTEVFPLLMFAVGGMLLMPAAADLLTMFIALEVLSLPLYVLCGLARHRRVLSQEAALKYFLLGAFSSALFLYGVALLYGYSGTLTLRGIATAIADNGDGTLAVIGMGLVSVGLLFKVGAVPFHSWVPDVYQGAPTPITGFMAAATKVAAFGAMLRLFYVALPDLLAEWRAALSVIVVLTMVGGALMAIGQNDVKRLLGYSAVAQAGFLLMGIVAANDRGVAAVMFYLLVYGIAAIAAFALVELVRNLDGVEDNDIRRWSGLARRSPALAWAFTVCLLAFTGIPLTSGFISKVAVFSAAAEGGAMALVVVGVLASAIAAFVYLRVIRVMFFAEPPADARVFIVGSPPVSIAVGAAVALTVLMGVLPQPLLGLVGSAGAFAG